MLYAPRGSDGSATPAKNEPVSFPRQRVLEVRLRVEKLPQSTLCCSTPHNFAQKEGCRTCRQRSALKRGQRRRRLASFWRGGIATEESHQCQHYLMQLTNVFTIAREGGPSLLDEAEARVVEAVEGGRASAEALLKRGQVRAAILRSQPTKHGEHPLPFGAPRP